MLLGYQCTSKNLQLCSACKEVIQKSKWWNYFPFLVNYPINFIILNLWRKFPSNQIKTPLGLQTWKSVYLFTCATFNSLVSSVVFRCSYFQHGFLIPPRDRQIQLGWWWRGEDSILKQMGSGTPDIIRDLRIINPNCDLYLLHDPIDSTRETVFALTSWILNQAPIKPI